MMNNSGTTPKMSGLLVGGSGLIGGYLLHYFKTKTPEIDVRAPNSKKLSLRELNDIISYFKRHKPDFVINTAITATYGVAGLKAAMDMLGYYGGPPRLPMLTSGGEVKEKIRDILVTAQLL